MHRRQGVKKFWIFIVIILLQLWSSLSGAGTGIADAANKAETQMVSKDITGKSDHTVVTQNIKRDTIASELQSCDDTSLLLQSVNEKYKIMQSTDATQDTATIGAEKETGNVLDIILTVEEDASQNYDQAKSSQSKYAKIESSTNVNSKATNAASTKINTSTTSLAVTNQTTTNDHTYKLDAVDIMDLGTKTYQEEMGPSEEELYYFNNVLTTENERDVYKKIVDEILATITDLDVSKEDYPEGYIIRTTFDESLESLESIKTIVHSIRSDHPEWYWFSNFVETTKDYKTVDIKVDSAFLSKETRTNLETEIINVANTVKGTVVGTDGVYEIVKKIHDYIITNTYYIDTAKNAHNILGVLLDGEGVCESYAKASQLLFNYFNIENIYVTGVIGTDKNVENSGHAWNQVNVTKDDVNFDWVNYDATWDDLEVNSSSKSYSEFNGISYRYFCRDDTQFAHSKYTPEYTVKPSSMDRYNYFKMNDILYIENKSSITDFMSRIANMIEKKEIKSVDGYYKLRVGYGVSLEYSTIKSLLKKDNLICVWNSGGTEGDQYLGFKDNRYYKMVNKTSSTDGNLYNTLSNFSESTEWIADSRYDIPLSQKTFFIQTQDSMRVKDIKYTIGSGKEQHLTLSTYLEMYDESKNLYLCRLPIEPNEGDTVYIDVSYTNEAMVDIAFEEEAYTATYGESINLGINVQGTIPDKPLSGGTVALYRDRIEESTKLTGFDKIPITNGQAVAVLNNGQADLPAGEYTIYAVYQGDTNYPSEQIASTTVTVSKATLYFTPDNVEREFGQENELTGTYVTEGFKYGETRVLITKDPKLGTAATETSVVGSYAITLQEDGVADNYIIKITPSHNARLKVNPAEPTITLSSDRSTAVVGEAITLTATIKNPYIPAYTNNLPSASETYLYLNDTELKQFTKSDTPGVYTYEFLVEETTPKNLNFKVVTKACSNYSSGTGTVSDTVTADTSQYLVSFDTRGFGENPESVRVSKNGKITAPTDPVDVNMIYQFDAWYTSTEWTRKWSFDTDPVTAPMVLYAKWKKPELSDISGVVVTPYTGKDYDGKDHPVATVTGTEPGDKVTYTFLGATSSDVPMVKNAGTYKLTVTVERAWCNPYITQHDITIKQVTPKINVSVDDPIEKEYTGNPISLDSISVTGDSISVTGVNNESVTTETLSFVYYVDDYMTTQTSKTEGATADGMAPSKAGTYYVKVYFGATGNYKSTFATAKVIIGKAEILDIPNKQEVVAAGQSEEYEYVLTQLLPTAVDFGGATFEYANYSDSDGILAGEPSVEDGKLLYKVVSAEAGKRAIVSIIVHSQNYLDKVVQLIITTKNKTEVTIAGVTTSDAIYNGKPYEYQGSYIVTKKGTGDKEEAVSIELEALYTGTMDNDEAYSSTQAPTDAGRYILTLSVPNSNKVYAGSKEYPFTIAPRTLEIRAKDMKINIGADAPTYESVITGLVETDTLEGVTLSCNYDKSNAENSAAGRYDIIISGGTLEKTWNYEVSHVNGILTVKNVHTITFDSGVSGGVNPSNIIASEGTEVTMPFTSAVKDGYDFVGWVDPSNEIYAASEVYTMIDADVTFIARWKRKTTLTKITAECNVSKVAVGTTLTKDNFVVTAHYSDGKKEKIETYTLSGNTISAEGDTVVTVSYFTYTVNIMVTGYLNNITKLEATYSGTVMAGQLIDEKMLTVQATYKDGTVEKITSGYTITKYTITVGNNNTLTLTYEGRTTTFLVEGVPAEGMAVLTFDSQGGVAVDKAVVEIGKTYSPAQPIKNGYVFKGWFTKVSGQGSQFTASTIVTGNATYYAHWEAVVSGTVSKLFATYHGELVSGELKTSDFTVMAVYDNYTQEIVDGFTLSTYVLVVGTNKIAVKYDGASVLVTLYVPDQPRSIAVTMKDSVYASGYRLTKEDMTVIATLADGTTEEITDYTLSNHLIHSGTNTVSITYDGKTEKFNVEGKVSYTVIFKSNGGTDVKSIQVITGRVIGALPVPTKAQCTFEGWYFDSRFTRKCSASNTITKTTTLYAKWDQKCPYTISSETIHVAVLGQDSVSIAGPEYVQWISEDLNIASIDSNGIITGINKGTVEIIGYTSDGYELSCLVTVGDEVASIHVPATKLKLSKNQTYKIKATVSPSSASTKVLDYSSSDVSVATVNQKGRIIPRSKGTCYIIIQTTDTSNVKKKIKVIVK